MSRRDIESIYPLSAVQQAFLLHSLRARGAERGLLQAHCVLRGPLQIEAFRRAWQRVIDRHPVLRTSIHWESLDKPLQVVHQQPLLPWQEHDWRQWPSAEQERRLWAFLGEDRERGFDLAEAPVTRLTLLRAGEDDYYAIWSVHHLVLDGWSAALVLKEVFAYYAAFCRGQELDIDRPRPYRDYIAWLQQQDSSQAEAFWRRVLNGFTAPTRLAIGPPAVAESEQREAYDEQRTGVPQAGTEALQAVAREHRITMNVLVQAAWALLLARYSGDADVVFGATFSGRSVALAGIESMVGVFNNTLPVRVQVPRDASLPSWLQALQEQQLDLQRYEYTSLADIQEWNGVPGRSRLFESLLVFENYPWNGTSTTEGLGLEIRNFGTGVTTNYPLTVVAHPGPELSLQIVYDRHRFDRGAIARVLRELQATLETIGREPYQRLSELPLLSESEQSRHAVDRPDPHGAGASAGQPVRREGKFVGPRTPMEFLIAEVWRDLLGVDRISVHDNFFDLGGYSLLAMRVVSRLEKTAGVKINFAQLVLETLGQLAATCEEQARSQKHKGVSPFARRLLDPLKGAVSRVMGGST